MFILFNIKKSIEFCTDSIDNNFVLWKSLDLLGAYEQPVNGLSRILMSQSSTDGSTPMEHAPEGIVFQQKLIAKTARLHFTYSIIFLISDSFCNP